MSIASSFTIRGDSPRCHDSNQSALPSPGPVAAPGCHVLDTARPPARSVPDTADQAEGQAHTQQEPASGRAVQGVASILSDHGPSTAAAPHQRGRTHRAASASDALPGAERTAAVIEKATGTVDIAPVAASGTTIPQRSTGDVKAAAAPGVAQAPVKARGRVTEFSTARRPPGSHAPSLCRSRRRLSGGCGRSAAGVFPESGQGSGGRARSSRREDSVAARSMSPSPQRTGSARTVRPELGPLCCFVLSCGPRPTRTASQLPPPGPAWLGCRARSPGGRLRSGGACR